MNFLETGALPRISFCYDGRRSAENRRREQHPYARGSRPVVRIPDKGAIEAGVVPERESPRSSCCAETVAGAAAAAFAA